MYFVWIDTKRESRIEFQIGKKGKRKEHGDGKINKSAWLVNEVNDDELRTHVSQETDLILVLM